MRPTVHVLHGDIAAGTFARSRHAGPAAQPFTVRDLLSVGPLRPLGDLATWCRERASFWNEAAPGLAASVPALFDDVQELSRGGPIVVWAGTAPADQLVPVFMVQLLRWLDLDPARLHLVQLVRRGDRAIPSLGVLSPAELADSPPAMPLDAAQRRELDEAWRAVTASEPEALVAFLRAPSARLPFLRPALRHLVDRYPGVRSGLGVHELRLLRAVRQAGPRVSLVIAHALEDTWASGDFDLVGDAWLLWRLRRLAASGLPHPALVLTGSGPDHALAEVALTPTGRRVLEGEENHVERNGIDDWIGGVHLSSALGSVWFQRDGELTRG